MTNIIESLDILSGLAYNHEKGAFMDAIITAILTIFGAAALLAVILYIPKLIQFGGCFKKPPRRMAEQKRKIALVVPARGESAVIGDLLASIAAQDYDKHYFDVNIIVKEADDPTVAIAKEAGTNVFIVPDQNCKGEALDGYFQSLTAAQRDSYAAFAIIDADAVLSPDYVTELNNALENDCQIFMTRKNIKNYLGGKNLRSLFCNCAALIYPVLDEMGGHYRTKRNIPVNFCGQGMMVRSEVIKEIGGWPYRTMTEDYEMRKDSILRGYKSMYYPYAVIYTEEVVKHKDCWTRRLRWVVGFSQCDHKYDKAIRKKFREEKASFALKYDIFFSIAPLVLFIAAAIVTSLCGVGLTIYYAAIGSALWLSALLLLAFMPLALMYFLELCYVFLTMQCYRDALEPLTTGEKIAMLFFAPLFNFEYFPIFIQGQLCLLTHKNIRWQHTARVGLDEEKKSNPRRIRLFRRRLRKENEKLRLRRMK